MINNVGGIDRVLRVVLGLALLAFCFLLEGPARWIGLVGAVPLATALIGWCPFYSFMGVNTCPRSNA